MAAARAQSEGIPLSAMNPKFLHSNSTSHTWPFSAVAELIVGRAVHYISPTWYVLNGRRKPKPRRKPTQPRGERTTPYRQRGIRTPMAL